MQTIRISILVAVVLAALPSLISSELLAQDEDGSDCFTGEEMEEIEREEHQIRVRSIDICAARTLDRWINERIGFASAELVRLTVIRSPLDDGANTYHIGAPRCETPGPVLVITGGSNRDLPFLEERSTGTSTRVVEGVFTRTEGDGFAFTLYRERRYRDAREGDNNVRVLLYARDFSEEVRPIQDTRPFLVVTSNIDIDPDARAEAIEKVQALQAAGFEDAEFLDSRQTTHLFCCHFTVVAARSATLDEARAIEARVEEAGFSAYVRRGWEVPSLE